MSPLCVLFLERFVWNENEEEMNVSRLGVLNLLCTLLAIYSLHGVSTPMAWESIDKHLSDKLMLIGDYKAPHMKFDGMLFYTQILIDIQWWRNH